MMLNENDGHRWSRRRSSRDKASRFIVSSRTEQAYGLDSVKRATGLTDQRGRVKHSVRESNKCIWR